MPIALTIAALVLLAFATWNQPMHGAFAVLLTAVVLHCEGLITMDNGQILASVLLSACVGAALRD